MPVLVCLLAGCSQIDRWDLDPWSTDYETAERRISGTSKSMLVVYQDGRKDRDGALEKVLKDAGVKARSAELVRCTLYRSQEKDRRYADQFQIQRVPSLILVHPDDTFHSLTWPFDAQTAVEFLDRSVPPGAPMTRNPLIARDVRYRWYLTQSGAEAAAMAQGKPLLLAFHRAGTADWRKLEGLLKTPVVYRRFEGMVHGQVTQMNPLAKTHAAPWGEVALPALAVVQVDGTHAVLEMPTSVEAVIHFADRISTGGSVTDGPASSSP